MLPGQSLAFLAHVSGVHYGNFFEVQCALQCLQMRLTLDAQTEQSQLFRAWVDDFPCHPGRHGGCAATRYLRCWHNMVCASGQVKHIDQKIELARQAGVGFVARHAPAFPECSHAT